MSYLEIIVIIVLASAIFSMMCLVLIPTLRQSWEWKHGRKSVFHGGYICRNRRLITRALKQLGSVASWQNKDKELIASYDFQGESFRLSVGDNSPYARLSYINIANTPIEKLSVVRDLCNKCNISSENCRMTYTIEKGTNVIVIHLVAGIFVFEKTKDILYRSMINMFGWQNALEKSLIKIDGMSSDVRDVEKDTAEYDKDLALAREQELMHQDCGPDWRQSSSSVINIKSLLSTIWGIRDVLPMSFYMMAEDCTMPIESKDIMSFDISSPLIAAGDFVRDNATLFFSYYDSRRPDKERQVLINLKAERKSRYALFYRITLTLVPLSAQKIIPVGSSENEPKVSSLLVAYDLTSPEQRLSKFRYLWKETLEKEKHGEHDTMTDEQRLMVGCVDSQVAYNAYCGKMLYRQKRYYEALLYLENAFNAMKKTITESLYKNSDTFVEIAYHIGFCYNAIKQYDRAFYYLELIVPFHNIIYTEEYVNCLVSMNDVRTIGFIEELQAEAEGLLKKIENSEQQEQVTSFLGFLNRRKAYLYINQHEYEEAEKLLKQLLDDPDSTDFAINELAYIQKLREEN